MKKKAVIVLLIALIMLLSGAALAEGTKLQTPEATAYAIDGKLHFTVKPESVPAEGLAGYNIRISKQNIGGDYAYSDATGANFVSMTYNASVDKYSYTVENVSDGETYKAEIAAVAQSGYTNSDVCEFIYTVASGGIDFDDQTLPAPRYGALYSETISITKALENSVEFTIIPGSLPAGLTLNASTGLISGKPTALTAETKLAVSVKYSGSSSPVTATVTIPAVLKGTFTITVSPSPATLYDSATLDLTPFVSCASPRVKSWRFSSTELPTGAKLSADGRLTAGAGTGRFSVLVTATANDNGYEPATAILTVTIIPRKQATLTPTLTGWSYGDAPSTPSCTVLDEYKNPLTGTLTYKYSSATYPESPTPPTAVGEYTLTAYFENAEYKASQTTTFAISPKSISGAKLTLTLEEGALPTAALSIDGWLEEITYVFDPGTTALTPGVHTATATGTGSYGGTAEVKWAVFPEWPEFAEAMTVTASELTITLGESLPAGKILFLAAYSDVGQMTGVSLKQLAGDSLTLALPDTFASLKLFAAAPLD